jgi:hypothetical protein
VRHLLDRVTVTLRGRTERADVGLEWTGGFTSQHELIRPISRYEQMDDFAGLLARIEGLRAEGRTSAEIAETIQTEGWRPAKRSGRFSGDRVNQLLARRSPGGPRLKAMSSRAMLGEEEWWLPDLAYRLAMPRATLHGWRRRGWVESRKLDVSGGRWVLWADAEELDRLRHLRSWGREQADETFPRQLTTPKRHLEG